MNRKPLQFRSGVNPMLVINLTLNAPTLYMSLGGVYAGLCWLAASERHRAHALCYGASSGLHVALALLAH
jgi:hypothetical protein